MSWLNRITNATLKINIGPDQCDCHEPGTLKQLDFKVGKDSVRIMEDQRSGKVYVGLNGKNAAAGVSREEAERILNERFQDHLGDILALPEF